MKFHAYIMNLTTALNSFPGRRGGAACCPRCRPGCSWWAAPPPTSPASRSSRCRTGGSQASEEQSKNRGMFSDRWMVTICNLYSLFISFLEIFECPLPAAPPCTSLVSLIVKVFNGLLPFLPSRWAHRSRSFRGNWQSWRCLSGDSKGPNDGQRPPLSDKID